MGYLLNGQWTEGNPPTEFGKAGSFERIVSQITPAMIVIFASALPSETRPSMEKMRLKPVAGLI